MRLSRTLVVLALALSACGDTGLSGSVVAGSLASDTLTVTVVDEAGAPVAAFDFVANTGDVDRGGDGRLELDLDGPVAGVVNSEGFLAQPVVLDPGRGDATVRLISRIGPAGGVRRSFHFGGDTMLDRRYFEDGYSQLPADELGLEIVDSIDEIFAAADHSSLNLETVVGTLPENLSSPGKRWTLQSVPEVTAMLAALGVDTAVLGNNHVADFGDDGVRSTRSALVDAGIGYTGAGSSTAEAIEPDITDVEGLDVGTVSLVRVNGDTNNEALPLTDQDEFAGVDPLLDWQYEFREIDVVGPSGRLSGLVRAGDAWQWFGFQDFSQGGSETEVWRTLEAVFPELQDSVVRRDHAGAAPFNQDNLEAGIGSMGRDIGLAIVQIHGGFQYQQAPASSIYNAAHDAVEAGADIVIVHHPHVFSGLEFYRGSVIAWGLGNFVFDQDLFATYGSGIVRLVFDESELIETSVIPLSLVDYRPTPVVGAPAYEMATRIAVRSQGQTESFLAPNGDAVERLRDQPGEPVRVSLRSDGLIEVTEGEAARVTIEIPDSGELFIPEGLVYVGQEVPEVEVGLELFGWGDFDQTLADGTPDRAPQWGMDDAVGFQWNISDQDGHLVYDPSLSEVGRVRPVSRIPFVWSRYFDEIGQPLQSRPGVEVTLEASASWLTSFNLRLDMYHFSDRNPARYPINEKLMSRKFGATVGRANTIEFTVDVPADMFVDRKSGLVSNTLFFYIENPATRLGTLEIDNVRVIEWRDSQEIPTGIWTQANYLKGPSGTTVTLIDTNG